MVSLSTELLGQSIWIYLYVLIVLIVAAIVGKTASYLIEYWLKRRSLQSKTKIDDVLVHTLDKPIMYLAILIGIRVSIQILTFSPRVTYFLNNTIAILFILFFAWVVSRFVTVVIDAYVQQLAVKSDTRLDNQLIPIINRVIRIAIFAIAITIALDRFGYDITSIIAGLGIGGLALALAAQETLQDVFGGFSIFSSKPFLVGDVVSFQDRLGVVEEIGIRYSKIRQFDGRIVTVPNNQLASAVVENWSTEPSRRVNQVIGLTYDTSADGIRKAKEILEEIFTETEGVSSDDYRVTFEGFGDFALQLRTIYFITDQENIFEVMHDVHLKIKEEFDKNGLDFAFPTQTIHLKRSDPYSEE